MIKHTSNRTRTLVAFIAAFVVLAGGSAAAKPVLKDSDVKKFISDFQAMNNELEQIDTNLAVDEEQAPNLLQIAGAMRANAEVRNVLRKYGWNEDFTDKYVAIMGGYLIVTFEDMRAEMDGEIKEQVASIDSNPGLSAEQKAQMKSALGSWTTQIDETLRAYRSQVDPADVATVKANRDALKAAVGDE
jgi:hypothetical protein